LKYTNQVCVNALQANDSRGHHDHTLCPVPRLPHKAWKPPLEVAAFSIVRLDFGMCERFSRNYTWTQIYAMCPAVVALWLIASDGFAQDVPRNALMEPGYVETRTCLDQSYKKLLRGGIKNHAALVSQGMALCRAQISVFSDHLHGTKDENSSMIVWLAEQQLSLTLKNQ